MSEHPKTVRVVDLGALAAALGVARARLTVKSLLDPGSRMVVWDIQIDGRDLTPAEEARSVAFLEQATEGAASGWHIPKAQEGPAS